MENLHPIVVFKRKIHVAISEIKCVEIAEIKRKLKEIQVFLNNCNSMEVPIGRKAEALKKKNDLEKHLKLIENFSVILPNML